MSLELTNLLPHSRIHAFRRRYFLRLATVALLLGAFLVLAHALLLLPTYLYSRGQLERERAELTSIGGVGQASAEQEMKARTTALQTSAAELARLDAAPTASAALRAVLLVPRPGITLVSFTFSTPAAAAPRLGISGVATSRDSLRAFAAALGALPYVSSADLPISAYAKESEIPFTISLSGTLKP